ncbi:MAG: DUF1569 domain-containing protein [Saprospiraceae bacterium]|nr:DUF1569 domain-containing protein [Saprospiraceae bacterium]
MYNLFKSNDKDAIIGRLSKLSEIHSPQWGKMNAHQVVVHMADPLRAALGDRPVPLNPSIFSKWPVNKLFSQWLPWPKGAPTAPEFIQGLKGTTPVEFEKDKQELILLIHRFSQHQNSSPLPIQPTFGNLNNKEWARLMWRHIDHHLRQFGL